MPKKVDANWFCENQDCGWSVTLSLSDREQPCPRCVCGWPLKRARAPLASPYLEFLQAGGSPGDGQETTKE